MLRKSLVVAALALVAPLPAHADETQELKIQLHGYYRARQVTVYNLANERRDAASPPDKPNLPPMPYAQIRWADYLVQRVRLEPVVTYGDLVKLQLTVDGLDNVVWGDNEARSTSPLFAADPSVTAMDGSKPSGLVLRRAWIDLNLKLGRLRVGRMASHWGMGLLSHGGGTHGGPDKYRPRDFGEHYFGSVFDRVLFATRPISVVKHLLGADDPHSNLILAYAYDKLVEDFLPEFQPRDYYRPLGESGFLGDNDDDVDEHVFVLLYRNKELELWQETDFFNAGLYVVLRSQGASRMDKVSSADGKQTLDVDFNGAGSLIHIWDFWLHARIGPLELETEWLFIRGTTEGGIPLSQKEVEAKIDAGVVRLSYLSGKLDAVLELGYASGDENLSDGTFTQRPMHPNHQVGLVLFPQVLRERTARTVGRRLGRGLQSNGGVFNATYLFPRVRYRPLPWLEGVLGVLVAWRDAATANAELYKADRGDFLGAEIDAALRVTWADAHLHFALETGYLVFGDGLKDQYLDAEADGAFTLQSRLMFQF